MPHQSLTPSIQEPEQHFGGASLAYFTNISNRINWTSLPQKLEMTTIDHGPSGSAEFRTKVEITGETLAQMPASAAYRVACLYALGHLDEVSLREAYQYLWGLYISQTEQANVQAPKPRERAFIKSISPLRVIERQPFIIGEE
jgi:hypothetical protein